MQTWYWLEALVVKGQNKQLWQFKKNKIKTGTVEMRAPSGKRRSLSRVWIQSEIQCDVLKAPRVEPDSFCSVWPSRLQSRFNYSSKFLAHLSHSEYFWVKSVLISICQSNYAARYFQKPIHFFHIEVFLTVWLWLSRHNDQGRGHSSVTLSNWKSNWLLHLTDKDPKLVGLDLILRCDVFRV